jgi:hypothetical protein
MMDIHYWAVLVSAIVSMIIGSIWYGPLFGKLFMREMGMDTWSKEKQDANKQVEMEMEVAMSRVTNQESQVISLPQVPSQAMYHKIQLGLKFL